MKLENQVSNKELSERLKELGVKQDSLFYWIDAYASASPKSEYFIAYKDDYTVGLTKAMDESSRPIYSAFTVAELGEMLPTSDFEQIPIGLYHSFLPLKENGKWEVFLVDLDWKPLFKCNEDTEADSRAKMLIYLLENNLINNG